MSLYSCCHLTHTNVFNSLRSISLIILLFSPSSTLFAHTQLTMDSATPPRFNSDNLKVILPNPDLPCGNENSFLSTQTDLKSILDINSIVALSWKETVPHSGQFLVDFSPQNDIFDNQTLLSLDDPVSGTNHSANFPLPQDVLCEDCTIRLRQTMDGAVVGSSFRHYFSCADIAIVDKTKNSIPAEVTNIAASAQTANSHTLSWRTTDTSSSEVVIVRKTLTNSMSTMDERLANFTHYPVGTSIGAGLEIVYRGSASSFSDTGLTAETSYAYEIFSRNTNYNYNLGSMQVVTTLASAGTEGNGGITPTRPPSDPAPADPATPSAGEPAGGSVFAMLLLFAGVLSYRIFTKYSKS